MSFVSARIALAGMAMLVFFFQTCSRPTQPTNVILSYEMLDEGGPSFKLLFHENGNYIAYQGLMNCGVPGVQMKTIPKETVRKLISAFTDSGFFNLPRILSRGPDPWGVTLTYRDDQRIHEVVDTLHKNAQLVKLEQQLRNSADVENWLHPSVDVYRQLVASGWDVNTPGEDRKTAIAHAAREQDLKAVKFLLQQEAAVSLDSLEIAAAGKNPEIFFSLLKAARSDAKVPARLRILIAAAQGDISVARRMVESGIDLNVTDREGTTPLVAAVRFHNTDLAKVLIAAGAEVNLRVAEGSMTPLMIAVRSGSLACTQLLVEKGAAVDLRDSTGRTALWYAAAQTNTGFITALARHGADLDARDRDGQSPLMHAMSMCYEWNIKTLLDAGADPSITDNSGKSAIQQFTYLANDSKCDRCRKMIEDALRDAGGRKTRR